MKKIVTFIGLCLLGHSFAFAEIKITEVSDSESICLSFLQVSKPSIPGIMTSNRIMAGLEFLAMLMHCSPVIATATLKPSGSKIDRSNDKFEGESSTTRI